MECYSVEGHKVNHNGMGRGTVIQGRFDGCTSLSDMRGAGMLRFSRHDRRIRDSVSRVPIVQWLPSLS